MDVDRDTLSPPVFIIGMHRSGTTLVAELLGELGINWGRVRDNYNESVCFQVLNEQLFAVNGCRWDDPVGLGQLFSTEMHLHRGRAVAQAIIDEQWLQLGFGEELQIGKQVLWGVKDPKTTFTLPVLHQCFPRAQVIHVLRNGIDVAISLQNRETNRPEGAAHPHYSQRCQSLNGCFALWKCYVKRALAYQQNGVDIQLLYYEDLLEEPENNVLRLLHRLGLEPQRSLTKHMARIDRSRRYGFQRNNTVREFAAKAAQDPLLAELYRERRDFWSHLQ